MNFNAAGVMPASSAQKPETFMLSPGAEQALPQSAQLALRQVDNLKYFLISAPVDWSQDQYIRRFLLPTGEYVSCVLWNNLFHISGTDIVRCLAFRFQAFGRPVKNTKKFEEGIFSDLRNLKAGNDASLEEPKSAFLDFLYKHNCIRTQKKQKVFYWYSVPHDRLFLDALERDLKREKAGQEATSTAVAEPALSFEYDSSQSLYEQLTKAQQESGAQPFDITASSSAAAAAAAAAAMDPFASASAAASTSSTHAMSHQPAMAAPSSQMVSQTMGTMNQDSLNDMAYSQPQQPPPQQMMSQSAATPMTQYPTTRHELFSQDAVRQSFPSATYAQQQRHGSISAAYMEYSPAPSFVSSQSHYEDYNNPRGVSYEPITPPQQAAHYTPEPAYASNDGNVYANLSNDLGHNFGSTSSGMSADASFAQGSYPSKTATAMYSHMEGSPAYRQSHPREHAHAAHRPSDLRRAVSASLGDPSYASVSYQTPTPEVSRHNSPMTSVENRQHSVPLAGTQYSSMMGDSFGGIMSAGGGGGGASDGVGPFRRARSATSGGELFSPYSQKTHSCPIPNCGRLFKRLEHLKRHVRTHTQERPYVCPQCHKAFSRSDNLAQHRRTHEEQPDGSFPAPVEEEDLSNEEDGVAGLEDQSGSFSHGQVHGLGMMAVPGSMGPPPLPASLVPGGF